MQSTLELLSMFETNGYEAYIVGGFVRDKIINKESFDIDICTNATPKEIKMIFPECKLPYESYGSVSLSYKKNNYEITTYRMDLEYKDGRRPSKVMYTDSLLVDLKRRDFTINTLCMDSKGIIIDKLGSRNDILNRVIKTVGDPKKKLKEDSLRILRAIRFACELNFKIDDELSKAIINNKDELLKLSYFRKKQELNKIFSSDNVLEGIDLLKKHNLESVLDITLNKEIIKTSDPLGIWVQVSPSSKYQFTSNELNYMKLIKEIIIKNHNITDFDLYKYGNYVCYISAQILDIDSRLIHERYDALPIKKKTDIVLNKVDIAKLLNTKDFSYVNDIINDIEHDIICRKVKNDEKSLKNHILKNMINKIFKETL